MHVSSREVDYSEPFETDDGTHWTSNSALSQVSTLGALEHQYVPACTGIWQLLVVGKALDPGMTRHLYRRYVQACTGPATAFNELTHELRVDHTSDDLRVLTTALKIGEFPDVAVPKLQSRYDDITETMDRFAGTEIVAWHRTQGVVQVR